MTMRVWGVVTLIGLLTACGSSSEGNSSNNSGGETNNNGTATGNPVAEDTFRDRVGEVTCDALEPCCTEAGFDYNPTICRAFASGGQTPPTGDGVTYDPEAAGDCLAQLQTASCNSAQSTAPACDRVYTGSTEPGGDCQDDSECAVPEDGEVECDHFDNVCATTRRGEAGDECSSSCEELGSSGYVCFGSGSSDLPEYEEVRCFREDGLFCSFDGMCAKFLGEGDACGSGECDSDTYCPFGVNEPVCTARVAIGGTCEDDDSCVEDSRCNDDGECEALKGEGEPCMFSDECIGSCEGDVCGSEDPFGELGDAFLGLLCGGGQ